jgi:glutamate synthase domain-containing protein 3
MDADDLSELHDLIAAHREHTASPVAERILADWDQASQQFVKVIPRDYKRALAELEEEMAREAA